jgi:signal transduction histidine kinase
MEAQRVPKLVEAHVLELPSTQPTVGALERWAEHQPGTGYACRVDEPWTCVFVTPTVERLLGVASHTWLEEPRRWLEHTHPEDRERLLVERMTAMTEHRRFSSEYRMVHEDGTERWVRDEAELEFRDGVPVLAHGLLIDLTYRHRSDAVIADLHESSRLEVSRLRQEIRERKAFVRLLAHDLRVPLSVVQAAVQTIDRIGVDLDEGQQGELLERATAAAVRCRDLIHQLLEIDRWTVAASITAQPMALSDLVQRSLADVEVGPRRVDLDVPGGEVVVDPVVVVRAMSNLLLNAVKHTPSGGTIRVRVTQHPGPAVVFSVEDEGPGIPDEVKERIFEPYTALAGDHEGESLGLGLALVGALAELHGGRVWVEDLPEVGSVFHLLIAGR